jgi:hypothetical protein
MALRSVEIITHIAKRRSDRWISDDGHRARAARAIRANLQQRQPIERLTLANRSV